MDGVAGAARCGVYEVPEDRSRTASRRIPLNVIILPATGASRRPDPLVFLQGGPGDAPSFNARFYSRVFARIREARDLVLVDLRGTGRSAALACPELGVPDVSSGVFDEHLLSLPAVRACRARLEQRADLRLYTTDRAVDDLDEVLRAMGYDQVNLYGTSYGSRVAQVFMQRHPSRLRTVSMKGIVPPSMAMPATHAQAGDARWRALVANCAADPRCANVYPTLTADLEAILHRLERETPTLAAPPNGDRRGVRVTITRGLFGEAFRNLLYTPQAAARVPRLLRRLAGGDDPALAEMALESRTALGGERLAAGFFLSVTCAEDVPYLPGDAETASANTFGRDYRLREQRAACEAWPRGTVPPEHGRPTRSSIPTLMFSGALDPVTPPSGGDEVLGGLSRGRHVVLVNNGHPIGNAEACVSSLMTAFIERAAAAEVDASCAGAIAPVPFDVTGDQP